MWAKARRVGRPRSSLHPCNERGIDRELCPVPQRQTVGDDLNTTLIVPGAAVGEVEVPEQRVGDNASPGLAANPSSCAL